MKRSKLMGATKRIVNYSNAGYYQVLSAEVGGKHVFSVSGLVFDEIHTQPNRQLYDVLTKGSSDARQNPLHFIITTAGNDRHSIAYELHTKAVDILEGRRVDSTFILWFTDLRMMRTGKMRQTGTRSILPWDIPLILRDFGMHTGKKSRIRLMK